MKIKKSILFQTIILVKPKPTYVIPSIKVVAYLWYHKHESAEN